MQRAVPFGPYLLVERIGLGGRSEVFRAERRTGQVVEQLAVKRALAGSAFDKDAQFIFSAEAELVSRFEHPGIVRVRDHGDVAGVPYVAYDIVDGVDLEKLLIAAGPRKLPLELALTIAIGVAEALEYVHSLRSLGNERPIVHRDVGPSNVLLGRGGEVKLADFGIAKVPGRNSTTGVGEIKGTIRYMSPEQVRGEELDSRSDMYGLGAVLLEMVTGRPPFHELRPVEILKGLARGARLDPDLIDASLPRELREVLRKVLAQRPAERYDTTAQLLEALRGLAEKLRVRVGREAVMHALADLFPVRVAHDKTLEESRDMADEKGGSDLDVFEGLAKKSVRSTSLPGGAGAPAPAVLNQGATSQEGPSSTLPAAPVPPPPSLRPGGASAKATLLGVPIPPLPPPGVSSTPLPLSPPSVRPPAATITMQGTPTSPPPAVPPPKSTSVRPLPPPAGGASQSSPPVSKPPSTLITAVPPPPKPAQSIGSAVGIPEAAISMHDALEPSDAAEENTPPKGTTQPKKADANHMDWEDEEESTHVFEKRKHAIKLGAKPVPLPPPAGPNSAPAPVPPPASRVGNAATLMMASGGAAAPRSAAPPPAPLPLPPPPVQSRTSVTNDPGPAHVAHAEPAPMPMRRASEEATVVRPREGSSGKLGVILGGLALVAVVGLAVFMLLPRTGELKITVKSKSGQPVAKAEIYVDGQKKCDTTPCTVHDVASGKREIKVVVGDQFVEATANVQAGRDEPVTVTIDDGLQVDKPAPTASAVASGSPGPAAIEGTGFTVSGPSGVKVLVDGKERGVLGSGPLAINDLPPGEHTVKLDGGELYKPYENKLTVTKGKMEDLGEQKLKVNKGRLTLELKTDGALVTLAGVQDTKKVEKKLDSAVWKKPPVTVSIDSKDQWTITATKKGFEDFTQEITFEDGVAEKTIVIELAEQGKPAPPPPYGAVPIGPRPTGTPPTATATATATAAPPASGNGTLSMNSKPVSNVILDGSPVGRTPVTKSVAPGKHTVTFIHPEKGKKTITVDVKPGARAGASWAFPP